MAGPKTVRNTADVAGYLDAVADPRRRADAVAACALIREVTGAEPAMWGTGIVGFGEYHYKYASGQEGDWPAVGLSPRRTALTLYVSDGFDGRQDLLERLGPHTVGKSCLHLKKLDAVDQEVLRELVRAAFHEVNGKQISST
jgi:hypothetical protein